MGNDLSSHKIRIEWIWTDHLLGIEKICLQPTNLKDALGRCIGRLVLLLCSQRGRSTFNKLLYATANKNNRML